ncbi:ead/Ea22-like family protein [Klebsiella pneumoniae]|uniref:ead/Ea22-like family protein n=1 Tax=Klebsiella pneumoniae TaxID=573 RepID=UPI00209E9B0A|nr:ead/Ea22-like family protein [Klebsiella pneumoniae]MCP1089038.1 ead/Ea22-like family protein [Klebsiella pneumoniae]
MTDITELAQSLKAAAEKATPGPWGVARDSKTLVSNQSHPIATVSDAMHRMLADGSTGKDAEFIALANPANIRALVEALEKAQTINAAAEKLVRCKGRYHSEQNYRALAALFGVNTPDLPPLDGESRTVTVKLPEVRITVAEALRRKMTYRELDAYNAGALASVEKIQAGQTDAGIKWEAE